MIPNAEHAPLIALTPEGHRKPMDTEVAAWEAARTQAEADHGGPCAPLIMVGEALVRRLRIGDMLDRRSIWAIAAEYLGADEEEVASALLLRSATDTHLWILRVKLLSEGPRHLLRVKGETVKEATAALCAHVWGQNDPLFPQRLSPPSRSQ